MSNLISKFIKSSLFSAIGLAILGILLFFESELTIVSISYIIGGILIAIGVLAFLNYISGVQKDLKNELDIIYGIGMIILGAIVISNPKAIASIIPFILGVLIVINSAAKLQYSIELRKNKDDLWLSTLVISIITLFCGVILVFNPFSGAEFITKIIGIILFVYSILDIISTLRIKKTIKDIKKVIEEGTIKEADIIEDNTSNK